MTALPSFDVIGPAIGQGCLLVGHWNVRSLNAHLLEVREIVGQNNFDIVAISETWLSQTDETVNVSIEGYQMFRKDRAGVAEQRGGGVALYIREGIKVCIDVVLDQSTCSHPDIEQLWVIASFNNRKIGICSFYRRPSRPLASLTALENSVASVLPMVSEVICLGDINVDMLKPMDPGCMRVSKLISVLQLRQVIKEPTRITESSSTLLDVVMVSSSFKILRAGTISAHGVSDHSIVYCAIDCPKEKVLPKFHAFRDFKGINRDALGRDATAVDWVGVVSCPDIDSKVDHLTNNIINICDIHVPVRIIRTTKPKAPWLTKALQGMIRVRNAMWTKCRKTKSDGDWADYRRMRNDTLKAIRKEKQAYITFKLKHLQSKEFWNGLRSIGVHKAKVTSFPATLHNPSTLNDHFLDNLPVTRASNEVIHSFGSRIHPGITELFSFRMVSVEQVWSAACAVKGRSAGWDGLSGDMVLLLLPFCLPAVTHIFNHAFETGTFPSCWGIALVRPIPKVLDPRVPTDLRPISILCFLAKVFEKLCYEQIIDHVSRVNILPECQSGFRRARSTATALLKVSDDVLRAFDESEVTALVLLDFSRAFDTLDHDLLIAKLAFYGFDHISLALMHNYLANRKQQVEIRNGVELSSSPLRAIRRGVPQGSLLGPLLFSIYAADLCQVLQHTHCHMYADDVQLYMSFKPNDSAVFLPLLNQDLARIADWATGNALCLNSNKSVAMYMGSTVLLGKLQQDYPITINGSLLQLHHSAKNLGLHVDELWSFRDHVRAKIQAAYGRLRALYPFRKVLPSAVKLRLTDALVLSLLDYCDIVYGPCLSCLDASRLQLIQHSCLRFAYGVRKYDHISPALMASGWLTMTHRRAVHYSCLVHKVKSTGQPSYLSKLLVTNSALHARNSFRTRGYDLLATPHHRTVMFRGSFSYTAAVLYNALPIEFKDMGKGAFKAQVRAYYKSFQ